MPSQVMTANGTIEVFYTKINSLRVGDIQLENINGFINPHDQSDDVLLGMNALKHLTFIHENGKLILKQY